MILALCFITPESEDSIGNGTSILPGNLLPNGSGPEEFVSYSQSPFKFIQWLLTNCGLGYFVRTCSGFTNLVHGVVRCPGTGFQCAALARIGATTSIINRKSIEDSFETVGK
jgi:hypothetical protein